MPFLLLELHNEVRNLALAAARGPAILVVGGAARLAANDAARPAAFDRAQAVWTPFFYQREHPYLGCSPLSSPALWLGHAEPARPAGSTRPGPRS